MMLDVKKEVGKFFVNKNINQRQFELELEELSNCYGERLVNEHTIESLYFLFLNLSSEVDTISLALMQSGIVKKQEGTLTAFFNEFVENGFSFPNNPSAVKSFILICDRDIEISLLEKILGSETLNHYHFTKAVQLVDFCTSNLITLIEFHDKYSDRIDISTVPLEANLLFEILKELDSSKIDEFTVDDLFVFLGRIMPLFVEKFETQMSVEELYSNTDRIVNWFMVWKNHLQRLEENLLDNDEYYKTEFATIIKYLTEYLWWNNGLSFAKKENKFAFGSPEFFFLATGGSIRKAPNQFPFTRRMAREFVGLPFDLDLGNRANLYIYLFVKSLGGGEKLSRLLMEFINLPDHKLHLQEELDKWNPVIQKLSDGTFENFETEEARAFIGYVYHCLRDKQNFKVQRRTIQDLKNDSDRYYERILERSVDRENRALAREELRARNNDDQERRPSKPVKGYVPLSWKSHGSIKPLQLKMKGNHRKNGMYQIIELRNETELQIEGRILSHCVGSYGHKCYNGNCTIWSMRQFVNGSFRSVVTIEISRAKRIIQMRGKMNANPSQEERQAILDWAVKEKIECKV